MRFKKEIKDRLYGGYLGVVTDKIDFEIIKVMLADDKKKVEGLEWPFGAVSAVIAVAPDGSVVALKEEHAESYELVKYQDAVEEDTQPIDTEVNEVAEMPDLSIVDVIPSKVEGNAEQFKLAVKSYLKRYDGIVVTVDNYKELSDTVSKLKKEMNDVNEKKKKVKKKAMEGYTLFENEMKEVLKMFESSIKALSDDIKQFTDKEVEENKRVVETLCKKALHDYVERNDFNEYFATNFFNTDPRWSTLKKFINNHKPTKTLVDEIRQECERVKKEYEIYQQKIEGLCIYLEAKCKESDIDQQMFDLNLYKKMLVQESLESLTKDIDCRINGILRNRELQKQKKEEAKKEEVKQQEPVNVSSEEKEPLKMLVGKIVGTNAALNELKTSLDYLKAKYDGCFDYDLRFPRKKEGK
ncbi:MAG: DUF1351 domain-containing protein [Catenibacterium sp.]|uniref:DUF1351 domain-containing protein n=1 Tax=Catenibacterium sp. TaxID=2049022 RepID=UPI002F94B66A